MEQVPPTIYGLIATFTAPYVATLTGTLTADRSYTFPDAAITVAGTNYANTWTVAQTFNTGTTVIGTADINGGAIDATAIGGATPAAGAFTTLSASGVITSTLAPGTAPFTVASTTVCPNLNVSQLLGATWAAPGAIGATTPAAVSCTTLTASGAASFLTFSTPAADKCGWTGTLFYTRRADNTAIARTALQFERGDGSGAAAQLITIGNTTNGVSELQTWVAGASRLAVSATAITLTQPLTATSAAFSSSVSCTTLTASGDILAGQTSGNIYCGQTADTTYGASACIWGKFVSKGPQFNIAPAVAHQYEFVHRAAYGYDFYTNAGSVLALSIAASGAATFASSVSCTSAIIGTDPGGSELLRVGGSVKCTTLTANTKVVSGSVTSVDPGQGFVCSNTGADFVTGFRLGNGSGSTEFYAIISGATGGTFGANVTLFESNQGPLKFSSYGGAFEILTGGSRTTRLSIHETTGAATFTGLVSVGGSTPASAAAAGTAGTITWDASYLYVCTATDTWKRVAIATW